MLYTLLGLDNLSIENCFLVKNVIIEQLRGSIVEFVLMYTIVQVVLD